MRRLPLIKSKIHGNKLSLLGVPISLGQSIYGTEKGPKVLRDKGLLEQLNRMGHDIIDHGDVDIYNPQSGDPIALSIYGDVIKNAYSIGETTRRLFTQTSDIFSSGRIPIIMGGDHSISIGSVAAALCANKNTSVVWIDAHTDIHTPETSLSMNMHGMPLSLLTGFRRSDTIAGFEWMNCSTNSIPKLRPSKLIYIGIRDIEHAEMIILNQLGITMYTMKDIKKYGIKYVMDLVMKQLQPSHQAPLHISFDIDSICPTLAPATGTPIPGGLKIREVNYIAELIARTDSICSLDMVEINPYIGYCEKDVNKTVDLGNMIISNFLRLTPHPPQLPLPQAEVLEGLFGYDHIFHKK